MDVQISYLIRKPSDPLSILALSHNCKKGCISNGIHGGAAVWLLLQFMKEPAKTILSYEVIAIEDNNTHKEGIMTIYCQVVHYLIKIYGTDYVIAKDDADIETYKQAGNVPTVCSSWAFPEKSVRCRRVYDESRLKSVLIE